MMKKGGLQRMMWKLFRAEDIQSAMSPLFFLCKLFGLHPLRSDQVSKVHLLHSFAILGVLAVSFCYLCRLEVCPPRNCLHTFLSSLGFLVTYITLGAYVLGSCRTRGSAYLALETLHAVDKRLKKHGFGVRYSTSYLVTVILKILFVLFHLLLVVGLLRHPPNMSEGQSFLYRISQILPLSQIYLVSRPFVVLVSFLDLHLQNLISRLITVAKSVFYLGRTEKLEVLVSAYNGLCDTAELINDSYCRQIFLLLPTVFFNITSSMFLFTGLIAQHSHHYTLMALLFIWTSFWVFLLYGILRTSDECQIKAREFSSILYNLMIEDRTKELINNDKLQLHLMMKREVKFTACDFFPLDNTLIHSMIAAATTYLVILIQFGPYEANKP